MRALSVRPPWAWAIAHANKRIENRSWPTSYRGPLAIHAFKTFSSSETAELEKILGYEVNPTLFKRGAFVAVADLTDVVKVDSVEPSPWLCGPYAWLLKNVRSLSVAVPASGRLGLWRPTDAQLRAIELFGPYSSKLSVTLLLDTQNQSSPLCDIPKGDGSGPFTCTQQRYRPDLASRK